MSGTEILVGRSYTRARRLPLMIGRLPGGRGMLWGGPYTLQQVVVASVGLVVMWIAHPLWARFDGIWNAFILFAVPAAAAFGLRRARIEGLDPLRYLLGLLAFYRAPAAGTVGGQAVRPVRARVEPAYRLWITPGAAVAQPCGDADPGGTRSDTSAETSSVKGSQT